MTRMPVSGTMNDEVGLSLHLPYVIGDRQASAGQPSPSSLRSAAARRRPRFSPGGALCGQYAGIIRATAHSDPRNGTRASWRDTISLWGETASTRVAISPRLPSRLLSSAQ